MNKKIILRKDQREIDSKLYDLRHNLQDAQKYLDWYNSVEFTQELKSIVEIKEYLTNPHFVYENAVKKHLTELTGLKTLPNNLDSLIQMYEIPEPEAWSVSDELGFDYLQIDKAGQLCYSQEIYDKIEAENTVYATPEQAAALTELNRMWANVETICNLFGASETYKRIYMQNFELAFDPILKQRGECGASRWNHEALGKLADAGFPKKLVTNK